MPLLYSSVCIESYSRPIGEARSAAEAGTSVSRDLLFTSILTYTSCVDCDYRQMHLQKKTLILQTFMFLTVYHALVLKL
jgi:hypothetical protein